MKSINARSTLNLAFWLCLFLVIGVARQGLAEEYYTYQDSDGKLVISNKPPPSGSILIKKQDFTEPTDIQTPKGQETVDTKVNGGIKNSPHPSKEK